MNEIKQVLHKETRFRMTEEFKSRLEKAMHLFIHAPVLNEQTKLVPTNNVPEIDEWGDIIGVNAPPE